MDRSRRSATRSEGPQSPPKQDRTASTQATEHTRRLARGQSSTEQTSSELKNSTHRLATVEEEEDERPNFKSSVHHSTTNDEIESDLDSISLNDSESTDDDEERLQELDHEMILDNLSSLYNDALKIVALFDPASMPDIATDLKASNTSVGRRYKQHRAHFQTSLQPYRSSEGFIRINLILRKLDESCGSSLFDTIPDALLYMANLAILAEEMVLNNEDSTLDFLANSFPGVHLFGAFGDIKTAIGRLSITPVTSTLIDVAVSLRTQYFISQATKHQKSDLFQPAEILQQAFFDDDNQPLGFEGLITDSVNNVRDAYQHRIKVITPFLGKRDKASVNLRSLRNQFPLTSFVSELTSWISMRKDDLKGLVKAAGGAEAITDKLLSISSKKSEESTAEAVAEPVQPTRNPRPARDRSSLTSMQQKTLALNRIKAQHRARYFEGSPAIQQEGQRHHQLEIPQSPPQGDTHLGENRRRQDDQGYDVGIEDEDFQAPILTQGSVIPSQKTAKLLGIAQRQAAQSNKENIAVKTAGRRFVDRQQDATRVAWDDSPDNLNQKRGRTYVSDDSDAFEEDQREPKRLRRSAPKTLSSTAGKNGEETPPGQDETEDNDYNVDDLDSDSEDVQSTAKRTASRQQPLISTQPGPTRSPLQDRVREDRKHPPSSARVHKAIRDTQPSSSQNYPSATQAAAVNNEAKNMVREASVATAVARGSTIQVRRAWSAAETERLMDLIAVHHTGWSAMLKADMDYAGGPELEGRGQVALKDKARNMKMDFLKAGRELPEGFEYVKIKNSDVDKLKAMGMRYHGAPGSME